LRHLTQARAHSLVGWLALGFVRVSVRARTGSCGSGSSLTAMIAPTELTQNYERLNTPYDPNLPIETLFQQIQDARAFAVAGGHPYGAAVIVSVAYKLVFNTGLFPNACLAWQSRAIARNTWAQLATAMASDGGTVTTLTTTNAKLVNKLEAAHDRVAQVKNDIMTLKNKIKPAWQGQRPVKTTNNNSYCWSHGYQVAKSHTSTTCNMQHEKERTSRCSDKDRHHGWSARGQGVIWRGS
jgi:hypothetical protein